MRLDINEIKRYLKYSGAQLDAVTTANIEKAQHILKECAHPQYVAQTFNIEVSEQQVKLYQNNLILKSVNLSNNLQDCKQMIILVATLGLEVDYQIRKLEITDLSLAFVLNAVAVEYLEKYLDHIQEKLEVANLHLKPRFSAGYGDLSIAYQSELINLVAATKTIGVNVLKTHIMVPSKSVSALIGLSADPQNKDLKKCAACLDNGKCSNKCIGKED